MMHDFGPDWNFSTTAGWIAIKSGTDIHSVDGMKIINFGDCVTFHLEAPWGWHLWLRLKCLDNFWMDHHAIWCRHFIFLVNFRDPLTYHLVPSSGENFNLSSILVYLSDIKVFFTQYLALQPHSRGEQTDTLKNWIHLTLDHVAGTWTLVLVNTLSAALLLLCSTW